MFVADKCTHSSRPTSSMNHLLSLVSMVLVDSTISFPNVTISVTRLLLVAGHLVATNTQVVYSALCSLHNQKMRFSLSSLPYKHGSNDQCWTKLNYSLWINHSTTVDAFGFGAICFHHSLGLVTNCHWWLYHRTTTVNVHFHSFTIYNLIVFLKTLIIHDCHWWHYCWLVYCVHLLW